MNENIFIKNYNKNNKDFFLEKENDILYLKSKNKKWSPFYIDFNDFHKRIDKNQEIIKAFKINKNSNLSILDTTAGMGRDSFILANFNSKVTMIERNKVIFFLLKNAIENSLKNENFKKILENIKLINEDSIKFLKNNKLKNIDIIYIDPMFPKNNKKKLVKKIIVKRMIKSPTITETIKPTYQIKGKLIRFDIYQNNNLFN